MFRVDDEWFIRADEVRQPMLDAAATVNWTPDYAGARMADWLRNMGDWNISRRRYWGLPLPFYPLQVLRAPDRDRVQGAPRRARRSRAWTSCANCTAPGLTA